MRNDIFAVENPYCRYATSILAGRFGAGRGGVATERRPTMEGNAKFTQAILDKCDEQGMQSPVTVCAVAHDGSIFCLRVSGEEEGGAELLCSHPEAATSRELPIRVFVVDAIGQAINGRFDDPEGLRLH